MSPLSDRSMTPALLGEQPMQHAMRYADTLSRLHRLESQHARDLHSGAMMQQRFLTPAETISTMLRPHGFETAIFTHSPHAVSGDFLSSRSVTNGQAALLLGDTTGNSLAAAMLSMRISNLVQTRAVTSPSDFLSYIHSDIDGLLSSGHFVTASYALIAQSRIVLANAGQPMPILLRDGITTEIGASGIPLGLPLGAGQYQDICLSLRPKDRIIMYTDGVTAMQKPDGSPFSRLQFRDELERFHTLGVHEMLACISSTLDQMLCTTPCRNDISILIMEYQPSPF